MKCFRAAISSSITAMKKLLRMARRSWLLAVARKWPLTRGSAFLSCQRSPYEEVLRLLLRAACCLLFSSFNRRGRCMKSGLHGNGRHGSRSALAERRAQNDANQLLISSVGAGIRQVAIVNSWHFSFLAVRRNEKSYVMSRMRRAYRRHEAVIINV